MCFSFRPLQSGDKVIAHRERVGLQLFALDHFQHRLALGADDRIAAEGVEMNPLRKRRGDLRRGHDRGERAAVADAFRHGDDVGDDALRFEAPEMRAGAPEAGLHFVRDADAARGAHVFVGVLQITVRKHHAAADALDRLGDEPRDLSRRRVVDQVLHIGRVIFSGLRIVVAPEPAIRDPA